MSFSMKRIKQWLKSKLLIELPIGVIKFIYGWFR